MNVTLYPNKKLLSREFVVQKRMADGSLQTMNATARNCFYTGTVTNHEFSRVAIDMCNGEMRGMIEAGDNCYLLEPGKDHSHVAYRMKRANITFEDSSALHCPVLDEVKNGHTKYIQSHVVHKCNPGYKLFGSAIQRCLPNGTWSGNTPVCIQKGSLRKDGIEVLHCPELSAPKQGTIKIQIKAGLFIAEHECMAGHKLLGNHLRFCIPTTGQWSGSAPTCQPSATAETFVNKMEGHSHKRRQASGSHLEIMVYVDQGVENDANQNGFNVTDYILSIINIMSSMFHDPTLEHEIDLTLTRLIMGGSGDFDIVQSASTTLDNFCAYQQSINPTSDNDPMHHDHAMLITSTDICGSSCSVVGLAPVNQMCSQGKSCTINEDAGFSTAFILAHEAGHNFGMAHDGEGNSCGGSSRLMAPSLGGQAENFLWSKCSAETLRTFINSEMSTCLDDVPINTQFKVNPNELPGLNYTADDQCRAEYGPSARFCPFSATMDPEEVCSRLSCRKTVDSAECITGNVPSADGTNCSSNTEFRICSRGKCVDGNTVVNASADGNAIVNASADGNTTVNATTKPIDGGWSAFGPYSTCSRTCGGGLRYRERQCNNPSPQFGGRTCSGESREYDALCNTDPCPAGSPSFIDQQCAATNDRPFNGTLYSWEEYTVTDISTVIGDPCELVCATANTTTVLVVVREPVAQDGTPCKNTDSSTGVCVAGRCTPVGCDNVLNSGVKLDACGVCNGTNSSGGLTESKYTLKGSGTFGYNTVAVIPAGARNVRVAETIVKYFNYIALESGGQSILNGGFITSLSGSFTAAGNEFQYNVELFTEEYVFTTGPLEEPLTVQVLVYGFSDSYSLSVEYYLCG
ncbi:A disintegrin and metalloproteinase with thrombospondin motifs 4-like [Dysidea avara]|uniref:A disintegrin and metalloproteinase with thrombospondin motifs 4-like n=1 Tax=Dysidea avara TaxID=196820 RepID=UPI00332737DD